MVLGCNGDEYENGCSLGCTRTMVERERRFRAYCTRRLDDVIPEDSHFHLFRSYISSFIFGRAWFLILNRMLAVFACTFRDFTLVHLSQETKGIAPQNRLGLFPSTSSPVIFHNHHTRGYVNYATQKVTLHKLTNINTQLYLLKSELIT